MGLILAVVLLPVVFMLVAAYVIVRAGVALVRGTFTLTFAVARALTRS